MVDRNLRLRQIYIGDPNNKHLYKGYLLNIDRVLQSVQALQSITKKMYFKTTKNEIKYNIL